MNNVQGWLRPKDAAEYVNVSERTIRSWIAHEGLRCSKVRGVLLINRDEFDSFLESFTVSGSQCDIVKRVVDEVIHGL